MDLPFAIPLGVVYAGLAGTLLALLIAAATNGWSLRVFLLLALRLAIGWHFLFEGLHKIHSHEVGPTETNRPFTSAPYFAAAEGPFGEYMRKTYLGDPDSAIADRITPQPDKLAGFASLSPADQAVLCPASVAVVLDAVARERLAEAEAAVPKARAEAEKVKAATDLSGPRAELAKANDAARKAEADAEKAEAAAEKAKAVAVLADQTDTEKWEEAKRNASIARRAADDAKRAVTVAQVQVALTQKKLDDAGRKVTEAAAKVADAEAKVADLRDDGRGLKAAYARWVYGVDRRDAGVKHVATDVPQSVPERLAQIALLQKELDSLRARQDQNLGNGYAYEQKRTTASRADLTEAKAKLVADADAFVDGLVAYAGGKPAEPAATPIVFMDKVTMWAITIIGACLLAGFLTRPMCVAGFGFLVLTYLTHPPFPWYPLPPNTEGNPVFVNKNVIEALALLVIASFPTGKWLGIDALFYWLIGRSKS
jgi:uncharacterized membrane protein YphA (DoxX/SURF4 family)